MCNKNGDDGYLLLNNWDWDAEDGDEDDTFVTNATSNDNDRIVSMDGWMDGWIDSFLVWTHQEKAASMKDSLLTAYFH
jgi:hypothetical protein